MHRRVDLFVTARSIRHWAGTLEARSVLPHLARRLALSTAGGIEKIDFPAYESAERPGFDGIVECAAGNAWVPTGRSVWELSSNSGVESKANSDFRKRTKETSRDQQERSLFIFLTPRKFTKKTEWADQRLQDGHWREVRAYDADDLEQWIEAAPAGVTAWFGRHIGVRPLGVDDVAQRWAALAKAAPCDLVPAVFLAGRKRTVDRITKWLASERASLRIDFRSPVEVLDFFCAAVAAMEENARLRTESRAVIVQGPIAWEVLRDLTVPAVLIVDPALALSTEEIERAVSNGHHVLQAAEPANLHGEGDSELEHASEFELSRSLEESGYPPIRAEQLARAAGGSLAILKHQLRPPGTRAVPPWASEVSSGVISACLLLGGWGDNESDRAAFALLAGRDYAACEVELQRMASSVDPLLLHAARNWRLISKDHAWLLFEDRVSSSALGKFETLAVELLADDDPRYLLPEEERLFANLKGHVAKYSDTIKKHVAETLALLGTFGSRLEAASSINVQAAVDRIVGSVLSPNSSWHRWASLGSRLALLAEASPDRFLQAARDSVALADSELVRLFDEEEETYFGRCNHAGLLWSLEGLAWAKEYVADVAKILLDLAERVTQKGKWSNRPWTCLQQILSHWMPYTTANVDERISLLDVLIDRNCGTMWPILLGILRDTEAFPTHTPYWRGWANEWVRGATRAESNKFVTATWERVLKLAGVDCRRWKDLFGRIGQVPSEMRDHFLRAADEFSRSEVPDIERSSVCEDLAKQLNRHRHLPNWALPPELLAQLDTILERLRPRSRVLRNAWLFQPWPDHFFERDGSLEDNQEAIATARASALCEILETEGPSGLEALIEHAKSPFHVGQALAMATEDTYLPDVVPGRLERSQFDRAFAAGFITTRFWPENWKWVDQALALCGTDLARSNLLTSLPISSEAWNRADRAGQAAANMYWDGCNPFNPDLEAVDVGIAVQRLCQRNRALAAIKLLSMAIHKKRALDADTLAAPLEALLVVSPDDVPADGQKLETFEVQQIIGALQDLGDVDADRLGAIEWHYIRLLDEPSQTVPLTLYKRLSSSPEFFNEMLMLLYRSKHASELDDAQASLLQKQYLAKHAFYLLNNWNRVPGSTDDGTINEPDLRKWCATARQIAQERGRIGVCDVHIGQLFARSTSQDMDATWPCQAIRAVAEEIATDALGRGMSSGILNSRGAVFRSSGGKAERELSADYRARADRIRFKSPFVARVLDSVARSLDTESKHWDEEERWRE
jgi:hypothetical protein